METFSALWNIRFQPLSPVDDSPGRFTSARFRTANDTNPERQRCDTKAAPMHRLPGPRSGFSFRKSPFASK